jgi:hypothetical protein
MMGSRDPNERAAMTEDDLVDINWAPHTMPGIGEFVILIINDADDDELVSAIANNAIGDVLEFTGGWDWRQSEQAARFTLAGPFNRTWRLPRVPEGLLPTLFRAPHYVVAMPAEIAKGLETYGDLLARLPGSLVIPMHGAPTGWA